MDNLFGDYLEGLIFFCGACAIACAIIIPLSIAADWLQRKLDEFNKESDEQLTTDEQ